MHAGAADTAPASAIRAALEYIVMGLEFVVGEESCWSGKYHGGAREQSGERVEKEWE